MKKLIAMIGAAAMAFGLYAADSGFLSGTSFNSWQTGKPVEPLTTENLEWSNISSDSSIGTANWVADDFGTYGVPENFKGIDPENALNIKSGLTDFATVSNKADAAGANIYVDTLVKFTAFDAEDSADIGTSEAKLGVWLKENADGTQTNLFITAGVVNDTTVTGETAVYDCGPYTAGEWCRLTIKSLGPIAKDYGVNGFVVFVNGSAVTALDTNPIGYGNLPLTSLAQYYANEKSLFPSIVNQKSFDGVLGFAGQGAIDDLVFTTQAPAFAEDVASYTLKWDTAHMENVKTNGAAVVGNSPLVVYADAPDSITFSWTGKDGKASGSKTITGVEGTFEITENDLDDAEAEFNGDPLTLAKAIEAANKAEADGTLKLLENATSPITIDNALAEITIDLNGQILTYEEVDEELGQIPAILAKQGSKVKIIDLATGGTVNGNVAIEIPEVDDPTATISIDADATFNGDATFVTSISDGQFKIGCNEDLDGNCALTENGHEGYKWVADNEKKYWVLELKPTKFAVTWDDTDANATAVAKVDNVAINSGDEVEKGKQVAFTVTPEEGYKYAAEREDGWTLETDGTITKTFTVGDEALVVTIPAATIKTFTVTVQLGEGITAVATNKTQGGEAVSFDETDSFTVKFGDSIEVDYACNVSGYEPSADNQGLTNIQKDTTLTKVTKVEITYHITYTTGNGAVVTNGVTEYTIETDTFNLPVAADIDMKGVTGVTFAGWTNATSEVVVTKVDKGTTGDLEFFAKWEVVQEPLPDPIKGGDIEAQNAYKEWAAKQGGKITDPTAAGNVDRFILGLDADVTDAAVKAKLDTIITADFVNQIVAKGFENVDFSALKTDYPYAEFSFVVAEEIPAETGKSGFYRLSAKLRSNVN